MGARWRRPFCVSVRRDPEAEPAASSPATGKRICAKFGGFFPTTASNPSTPTLRCRTTEPIPAWLLRASSDPTPPPLLPSIATEAIPLRLRRASSEPSSPKSPSRFALLKATLRLSTSRCGVCAQSVKSSGDRSAAVFTAECSHTFHFSCIAARGSLVCPVCSATWRSSPLLSSVVGGAAKTERNRRKDMNMSLEREGESKSPRAAAATKVYDDDEPLVPSGTNRFNPIPEADDEDADDDEKRHRPVATEENLQVCVVSEAALVSAGRSHRNYVVAVKVKAPSEFRNGRAPIDLVTVLDVRGDTTTAAKLQMLKRAMRQLIASLGAGDRLSIVAFSSTAAKRLLSLHRMSRQGQRLAGQVVDRLILTAAATQGDGGGTGAGDALRKAAKVLEDRRERNPVATIMLLSDAQQADNASTRLGFGFGHVEIPIHASGPKVDEEEEEDTNPNPNPNPNPFMQCVLGGLLSVVMRDVTLQLIFPAGDVSSVYSCSGRAVALGGGGTVRLGDLKAGEERMLLVELRLPVDCRRSCMAVRCSYRPAAAASQEVIRCQEQPLPLPPFHRSDHSSSSKSSSSTSSSVNVQRVRNLFVATRAVAESRRLAELGDLATAVHLLASARTLLLQSSSSISSDKHLLLSLEAEIVEIQQRRQQQPSGLMSRGLALMSTAAPDDGREALTPTSAWRAAERLAKLAIMRKSLNRVSDLHGFENARF